MFFSQEITFGQSPLFKKCDSLNGIEGLRIGRIIEDNSLTPFNCPEYKKTPKHHLQNWWKLSYNIELFGYYQTDSIAVRIDDENILQEVNFYLGKDDWCSPSLNSEFNKILGESVHGYTWTFRRTNQYWFGNNFTVILEHRFAWVERNGVSVDIYPLTVRFLPELTRKEQKIMGTPKVK